MNSRPLLHVRGKLRPHWKGELAELPRVHAYSSTWCTFQVKLREGIVQLKCLPCSSQVALSGAARLSLWSHHMGAHHHSLVHQLECSRPVDPHWFLWTCEATPGTHGSCWWHSDPPLVSSTLSLASHSCTYFWCFASQLLPPNFSSLKSCKDDTCYILRPCTMHAMVSHDTCKVQLTRSTNGLSTRAVEGNFDSYQTVSSLFGASGAWPYSRRSSLYWIATAPSQPKHMGPCSTPICLACHIDPIQPVTCVISR
jgi:hypothetical protein